MPAYHTTSKNASPARIAQDLLKGIDPAAVRGGFGLLVGLSSLDNAAVLRSLEAALPCPIFGCTSISLPFDVKREEISASLLLINKLGLRFAAVFSPPADPEQGGEQMRALVAEARTKLGEEAKMFLVLAPLFPEWTEDRFFLPLYEAAGDTPVFGGMASDHVHEGKARTLYAGAVHPDRTILIALAGEIKPLFAVECEVKVFTTYNPTITEAEGSILRRVDELTLAEYLRLQGFNPDAGDFLTGLSMVAKIETHNPGGPPEVEINHILSVDPKTGAGKLAREVRRGSAISLAGIDSACVAGSAVSALTSLLRQIELGEAEGASFDVLLAVSCLSRYFVSYEETNVEGEHILANCPKRIALNGFFGYNEICPVSGPNGKKRNRSNGFSLALCAF